jgi:translation initiation factor 3 subunit G
MARTKIRWGDTLDDEDALPPTTVRGPDNNGVKITTGVQQRQRAWVVREGGG